MFLRAIFNVVMVFVEDKGFNDNSNPHPFISTGTPGDVSIMVAYQIWLLCYCGSSAEFEPVRTFLYYTTLHYTTFIPIFIYIYYYYYYDIYGETKNTV